MKPSLFKMAPTRLFVIIITVLGISSVSWMLLSPSPKPSSDLFEMKKNLDIFYDVYGKVEEMYVDEPQPGALMKTGIDAMLKSLDPYTVYYPESKMEDFKVDNTGIYGGIGAVIATHAGAITVVEAEPGQPAYSAGIRVGDVLVKIDGNSLEGKNHNDVNNVIKGQPGTDIEVTYKRPGQTESKTVSITREHINIPVVPYYGMVDDKTGYIKLTSFTQTAYQEVKTAYLDLQSKDMKQFVLDLRGNGGGLVDQAVDIVNMFVPKGQDILIMKGRGEKSFKAYTTRNNPIDKDIPMAVLVDETSASASEIVSGALQDLDRAVIIGTRTFGKGLVQQTHPIKYNSMIKITVAKYYIPSGRCVQKIDYSNKQNGKANEVPDSLVKTFKTRNGRKVQDGSGVNPDIHVNPEEASNFIVALLKNNVIFDFVTQFASGKDSIASPKVFNLTESEFKQFKTFALSKNVEYTSKSLKALEQLQQISDDEKYKDAAILAAINDLKKKYGADPSADLDRYKSQIVSLLESKIVARFYHTGGRMEHALEKDIFLDEAIQILNDESDYNKVLGVL